MRLVARSNAAEVLKAELRRPSYRCDVMAIGTNPDADQPIERDRRVMRGVLAVSQTFRHPVGIAIKGTLIARDVDILAVMGQADLACKLEPLVPSPARRLRAIEALAQAGVQVRAISSPLVPDPTDHELEGGVIAARDVGAAAASMIPIRLPREVTDLWQEWRAAHYPERLGLVTFKLRDMRDGKPCEADFGKRMSGEGIWAELLKQRYRRAVRAVK